MTKEERKVYFRKYWRKRRERLRLAGKCIDCGQEPKAEGRQLGPRCLEAHKVRFSVRSREQGIPKKRRPVVNKKTVKRETVDRMMQLAELQVTRSRQLGRLA